MTPPRWIIIGTDTEIGKTHCACLLLRHAAAAGHPMLPQKPAASGEPPGMGDPERLAQASSISVTPAQVCPRRFNRPLAPGVAAHPGAFVHDSPPRTPDQTRAPLDIRRLERLEQETRCHATLVEGAGGLWVPMPGPSWLPDWIAAYAARPILVARAGLGTINHTLLTIDALTRLGHPPVGLISNQPTPPADDPSTSDNVAIIEAASGVACLATIEYGATTLDPRPALEAALYLPMQKFEKMALSTSSPTAPKR